MNKKPAWIGLDDAIAQVMRHKNCSRATARRLIAEVVASKKVRTQLTKTKSPLRELSPDEVGRKLAEGADHKVLVTLDEFMRHFKLTWEETLGELQTGRLIAGCDESTHLMMTLGKPVEPQRFTIDVATINEWLQNPQTPSNLIVRNNTLM